MIARPSPRRVRAGRAICLSLLPFSHRGPGLIRSLCCDGRSVRLANPRRIWTLTPLPAIPNIVPIANPICGRRWSQITRAKPNAIRSFAAGNEEARSSRVTISAMKRLCRCWPATFWHTVWSKIKQLGSKTQASRRVVHDSERFCAWNVAVRLEREKEERCLYPDGCVRNDDVRCTR
jgi:hypothetical protein